MQHNNAHGVLEKTIVILEKILELDGEEISADTYIVRDLGAESIDLLEVAVGLNQEFGIKVQDDHVFLWRLRYYLVEARKSGVDVHSYLAGKYPFLDSARIAEILIDLDKGPVLKVRDIISYINFQLSGVMAGK